MDELARVLATQARAMYGALLCFYLRVAEAVRRGEGEMSNVSACQCPETANGFRFSHAPDGCQGVPFGLFRRDGQLLWLCERCDFPDDERLPARDEG